jgi:hypothetical protein
MHGLAGHWSHLRAVAAHVSRLPHWLRVLAVVLLMATWVLVFPRGGLVAAAFVPLTCAIVVWVAYAVADDRDRRFILACGLFAILAREMLVGLIDVALLSRGNVSYAPDEATYVRSASRVYHLWLDPAAPFDHSDPYARSWYVHLMARLYQLAGGENIVVVKLVNTSLAVVAALLAYRTMRNFAMPGARWALVLLLAFPSIAFWSALALKDSYVIFFLLGCMWSASEFIRTRRPYWLALAVAALLPLESVRVYMLVTGALALLAVPLALTRWKERLAVGGALLATVYVLFAIIQPFRDLGANIFYVPIFVRGAVAQGARSSFVEPAAVVSGEPGEQIVIAVPGVTPSPGETPRVVFVQPGTEIIVQLGTPVPSAAVSSVRPTPAVIRPGDIVAIAFPVQSATPTATPAVSSALTPTPVPRTIFVEPEAKNTVGLASERDPDATSVSGSLATNIRHLPLGVLYTLFAPFPWTARTLEQFATIPEMLLWYVCLPAALVGAFVLLRRRNLLFAHGFAMTVGLVLVLSLIGANVGTLIRSRAMLIPYVLMLSGVGISFVLARYPRLTTRSTPSAESAAIAD